MEESGIRKNKYLGVLIMDKGDWLKPEYGAGTADNMHGIINGGGGGGSGRNGNGLANGSGCGRSFGDGNGKGGAWGY